MITRHFLTKVKLPYGIAVPLRQRRVSGSLAYEYVSHTGCEYDDVLLDENKHLTNSDRESIETHLSSYHGRDIVQNRLIEHDIDRTDLSQDQIFAMLSLKSKTYLADLSTGIDLTRKEDRIYCKRGH